RQFSEDPSKIRQWQAFLNKNHITAGSLTDTVSQLDLLLWPPTEVAAAQSKATATWMPEAKQWV
ncbi:MAG TPA: nucleotidyl transferase AbiEii/AbiGii toxin family protein, partial [Rhodoferax sp.]